MSKLFVRVFSPIAIPMLFLALPLLGSGCGGDDSIVRSYEGQLRVTPESLTFSALSIGAEAVQYLTIENIGQATLIIEALNLDSRSSEFATRGVDLPLRLAPGEERVIEVTYTPDDCGSDRGNLVIHSNDRTYQNGYIVPLQPQGMGGQVRVSPNPVDFGRVPAGDNKTLPVTITNVGTCPLDVNDLFLTGSFDFQMTQDVGAEVYEGFEPTLPLYLEPADEYEFFVTFSPSGDGFDEATLLVRSDDANNRTVEVPVLANGGQPCIIVTEEEGIDFTERFFGEIHPKTVTITNCSQREPLIVSSIALSEHWELIGFDRYSLTSMPDLSGNLVIQPQESTPFVLNYEPIEYSTTSNPELCSSDPCQLTDGAILTIESNDEVKSPLEIEVRGIGTNNHCPVAVARARVQASGDPWDTQIDTIPLATLEFDGSASSDSEGAIATYQWEVTNRPDGSTALFAPNAQVANPTFFLDLAGSYQYTLRVFDQSGLESCEPATVMALVTPGEHIHIQLVWETPSDNTRNDSSGSDVDLHFIRQGGTWNSPDDCYYMNMSPNWGGSGGQDDPSLDIDDVTGWGPENINLNNPQGTSGSPMTYHVGVFYYSDHLYGPSDTTIRIYLDGVERFASTFYGLTDRQFWDVARIVWPTREIIRIHRLYPSGFP